MAYKTSKKDMDRPIAIRKGVRSCTQHPIQHHLSYTNLSLLFRAFVTSIDWVPPNTVQEGLQKPEWKAATLQELQALEKNGT